MRKEIGLVLGIVFIALPCAAADGVIYKGIDLFHTRDDGSSFMDFSREPIPAGFFCRGSEPFTGKVIWRGAPVATAMAGELRGTDTIVHRLDDAVFNKRGVATTRIQFRAVQLESVTPIKTACGSFNVRMVLDGRQPVTRMKIVREGEYGGRFLAPLALRGKLVFTPVSGNGQQLELPPHFIRFPVHQRATWAYQPGSGGLEKRGGVLADTDFDSRPDTFLPGTSNFAAGWNGSTSKSMSDPICHTHGECGHCVEPYNN
jgi:hypothetical protein